MATFRLIMPKMGESVIEATILTWHKKIGDIIKEHDVVLEVATDKVDSEVPSPVSGILKEIIHQEGATVAIGEILAIIDTDATATTDYQRVVPNTTETTKEEVNIKTAETQITNTTVPEKEIIQTIPFVPQETTLSNQNISQSNTANFYSPLVLNIAQKENISAQELATIKGTGLNGRLTKDDVLGYLQQKNTQTTTTPQKEEPKQQERENSTVVTNTDSTKTNDTAISNHVAHINDGTSEIIEMDRMRKLIAKNMVASRKIAAHVSSFVECDITTIVKWREQHKEIFKKKYGFNLTYLPVFIQAITAAIKEYPNINVSVDGDYIIKKKAINIGIATALPSGNLIVPVIKNADQKNLFGIALEINNLVQKARANTLTIDDISEGTYTVSNIGTFGNILGTPIILQPQVAIMAIGVATKKPVVIEHDGEDVIAIRHMLYLSHTYDHRVVDGMLGGLFVKKVADILHSFDSNTEI